MGNRSGISVLRRVQPGPSLDDYKLHIFTGARRNWWTLVVIDYFLSRLFESGACSASIRKPEWKRGSIPIKLIGPGYLFESRF